MLYAIGDIHGRLDKLEALLGKLPIESGDRFVFLGDYVDQVRLQDDSGVLWEMNPRVASGIVSEHMTTPLVLPVGSRLTVELEGGNQPTVRIHIVGRLVTM